MNAASVVEQVLTNSVRGFLLAGLLPAGVLVAWVGLAWFGLDRAVQWVMATLAAPTISHTTMAVLLGWILTALLLYQSRSLIVSLLSGQPDQSLPTWIRSGQLARAVSKRLAAHRKLDARRDELHTAGWLRKGLTVKGGLSSSRPGRTDPSSERSRLLRDLFGRSDRHRVRMLLWRYSDILQEVRYLHNEVLREHMREGTGAEILQWRRMVRRYPEVFEILEEEATRRFWRAYDRASRFPAGAALAGTRLGNARERMDDYCNRRYGISTYTLWNRLKPLLDEDSLAEVAHHKQSVETLAVAVAVVASVGLVGAFVGLTDGFAPDTVTVSPLVHALVAVVTPWLLAWLLYSWAVLHTGQMGDSMAGIIDANRRKLLQAFGLEPRDFPDELRQFRALSLFFENGSSTLLEKLDEAEDAYPGNVDGQDGLDSGKLGEEGPSHD